MSLRVLLLSLLMVLCVALVACGGDTEPAETSGNTTAITEGVTEANAATEVVTEADATQAQTQVENEEVTQMETTIVTEEPVTEEPATEAPETEAPATEAPATEEPETEAPETEAITDVMIGETLNAPYAADFTVSNVFSDDMVVQRNEHIRVWGFAPASENGKKVSGEFKGMFAEAIIENGEWVLTFGARMEADAGMGNTMKIYTDSKSVEFNNVLVGDVYMVIGQSNVAFPMASHWQLTSGKAEQTDIDPNAPIRVHYNSLDQVAGYPQRGTTEVCKELKNGSQWQKATVANITNFSALGYLFAYHMIDLTDGVPVGMIEINGNGQPLGAFLPNEIAEEKKTDRFDENKGYYVTSGTNADWGRYMYNHYMFPFEKYAMAGIVWYQGESDWATANAKVFAENFTAYMNYMRGTHNLVNKDFPVFLIEFPTNYQQPAGFTPSASAPMWAAMDVGLIRAVLGRIPQMLPNSYVSVSSDLWLDDTFWNSLHPYCKYEQAERCAKIAASVMGIGNADAATGPILVSVEVSEDGKTAILTYDNVGRGLKTSDGGDTVKGFGLIDKSFRINNAANIKATITGKNQVTITARAKINGIIYNHIYYNVFGQQINLCNSYGVPAGATIVYPSN